MQKSFNATPQLIVQARDYISQHFCEDLSLDRLSHVLGINKYYFVRLFKSSTGYTPNEYIIMERINHAKELLRSTDLTINEVADEVGLLDDEAIRPKRLGGVAGERDRGLLGEEGLSVRTDLNDLGGVTHGGS